MAHMIENNEIAFAGEVPWHGLGTKVEDNATWTRSERVNHWLTAANLDWSLDLAELAVIGRNDMGGEFYERAPVAPWRVVRRTDNGRVFKPVSRDFQLVQPRDIVEFFADVSEGQAQIEVVGALRGGAVLWALARLGSDLVLPGGDDVKNYACIMTANDGSLNTRVQTTSVRVVCNNTLQLALQRNRAQYKLSHRSVFDAGQREIARRAVGLATDEALALNRMSATLAGLRMDDQDCLAFFRELIDQNPERPDVPTVGRLMESLMRSPGAALVSAQGTAWGALNAVTHYVDHVRGRNRDTRLTAAWAGEGASMKMRAIELLTSRQQLEELKEMGA